MVVAVAGFLDPSVTAYRAARPEVSVIALDSAIDGAQADRVAKSLASSFTVLRASFGRAAATVLVGDSPPPLGAPLGGTVFSVLADRPAATVTLEVADAPSWAPLDGRVLVRVVARVTGAKGRAVEFALQSGPLTVATSTEIALSDDARVSASLTFIPSTLGATRLRVSASISGNAAVARSDLGVEVGKKKYAVLFYDARPSWMSTFVRRAIERDPRFEVTSRVVTSRNISTDVGQPPALGAPNAPPLPFDVIVVGAPESLREADVAALRQFSAQRGGTVVLLADQRVPAGLQRVAAPGAWSSGLARRSVPVSPVTATDSGSLSVTELAWPVRLPSGAVPLAVSAVAPGDTLGARPVVWRVAEGAGQIVVSGALDSWRFRDRTLSAFDNFWRLVIADAAASALPTRSIELSTAIPAVGERVVVSVIDRSASLRSRSNADRDDQTVEVSGLLTVEAASGGESARTATEVDSVRLFPTGQAGELQGTFRAPGAPGAYRLSVGIGAVAAERRFIVSATAARHPSSDARDLLKAFATSRGGRAIGATELGALPALLTAATRAEPRLETWHLMRSAWWIVPFALLLGFEWWLRRRRGLA